MYEFITTLRNRPVKVRINAAHGPEPDVGILGPWSDDWQVFDEEGQDLTMGLSDPELDALDLEVSDFLRAQETDTGCRVVT